MNISFAWTTDAFMARKKTVTRRKWDEDYAEKFQPPGSIHNAWNISPRFKGRRIGRIVTVSLRFEPLLRMVKDKAYGEEEMKKEGGLWRDLEEFITLFQVPLDYPLCRYEFNPLEIFERNNGLAIS